MAKRFVDTELWDKKWFMQLTAKQKCLVKYVRDKCDVAGIWDCNYQLASVYIGEIVTEQELLEIDNGKQFQKIADEKIYCTGFIEFQYGQTLNEQSPIHKKVMDLLDKYGSLFNSCPVDPSGCCAFPILHRVLAYSPSVGIIVVKESLRLNLRIIFVCLA